MKKYLIILAILFVLSISSYFLLQREIKNIDQKQGEKKMSIVINDKEYEFSLEDNKTTQELKKILPLKMTMEDLNNNEKYYYLDKTLPTKEEKVKKIQKGDVMLYQNNCLVIFYKDFATDYAYTKIGHIKALENFDKEDIEVELLEEKR